MRDDCRSEYNRIVGELRKSGIDYEYFVDLMYISRHGFLGDTEHKEEYKYYSDYEPEIDGKGRIKVISRSKAIPKDDIRNNSEED